MISEIEQMKAQVAYLQNLVEEKNVHIEETVAEHVDEMNYGLDLIGKYASQNKNTEALVCWFFFIPHEVVQGQILDQMSNWYHSKAMAFVSVTEINVSSARIKIHTSTKGFCNAWVCRNCLRLTL